MKVLEVEKVLEFERTMLKLYKDLTNLTRQKDTHHIDLR